MPPPAAAHLVMCTPHAHRCARPAAVFVLGTKVGEEQKQNRLQTIASIVNTMMGTTIVALPYGMATTGLALGAVIIGIMGVISCFTCLMIMKYGKGYDEFSDMVAHYLGRYPRYGAWLISVAVIVGAAMVYHILMQESLYQLVGTIITAHSPDAASHWKRVYAAMVPLIVYPVCNMKDMSALVKVNSLGFLFLWYTIMFVLYHGFHAMSHSTFSWVASQDPSASFYAPDGSLRIVYGGQSTFSALGGMMMLSFFIHNAVQAITKNAQPATVRTDVVIAYVTCRVCACVRVCGCDIFSACGVRRAACSVFISVSPRSFALQLQVHDCWLLVRTGWHCGLLWHGGCPYQGRVCGGRQQRLLTEE
ncbi:hypothetical protein EON66_05730 [archaeon]|nr:MAG: hypothetical protein EON66_05730 [archaeon]